MLRSRLTKLRRPLPAVGGRKVTVPMSKFNPNDTSFDKLSLSYSPFPEGTHLVFISDATAYTSSVGSKSVEV